MSQNPNPTAGQVDIRGPRFAAWITTGVLVLVLVVSAFSVPAAAVLIGLQAIVFALGASDGLGAGSRGPRRSPYGWLFATFVAPRLGPATETEPVAPLRFAQLVGFVFAAAGFIGFVSGAGVVGALFTAFALFAAFLNAAFGICLGCMIYPLAQRLIQRSPAESTRVTN